MDRCSCLLKFILPNFASKQFKLHFTFSLFFFCFMCGGFYGKGSQKVRVIFPIVDQLASPNVRFTMKGEELNKGAHQNYWLERTLPHQRDQSGSSYLSIWRAVCLTNLLVTTLHLLWHCVSQLHGLLSPIGTSDPHTTFEGPFSSLFTI